MSNRAERRAAEHAARKLAYKEQRLQQQNNPNPQISEAQLAANRANARRSTGPTTPQGRATSSRNALKYALTGSTVLLPTDDTAEYDRRRNLHLDAYRPATEEELRLVQSIADSYWRIDRIQCLETGILFKGAGEFEGKFDDQPTERRAQLIRTEAYLKYEKSLRNLQIQEARLLRRIEKDRAELVRLQTIRKREELLNPPAPEPENGFEFSSPAFDIQSPPATGAIPDDNLQTSAQASLAPV